MMERFEVWVVEEGTGTDGSEREDELAVLPLLLLSIMDRERSRYCLDWRNFGNLDEFAAVEGDEELRDLEDIRIR
jgi:hypothetical protein